MSVVLLYSRIFVDNLVLVFFKQKTAYEMRISDWSSDVCSSDLNLLGPGQANCAAGRKDECRQGAGMGHRRFRGSRWRGKKACAGAGRTHQRHARRGGTDVQAKHQCLCERAESRVIEIGRASCRERVCKYV